MRVVSGWPGIVAASYGSAGTVSRAIAVLAAAAVLAGCGQRGPLYLPSIPPLPQPPAFMRQSAASSASAVSASPTPAAQAGPGGPRTAAGLSIPTSSTDAIQPAR